MTAPALVLGLAAALLSGCALLEGPTPETPEREVAVAPEVAPEFFPEGSAEQNLPYFTSVMSSYASGEQPVNGAPLVNAITESGFSREAMQVSFDNSETGLPADSIYVSVRIGLECLIGQLVAGDREAVAIVAPAVGPDQDICLIGNTRLIDW